LAGPLWLVCRVVWWNGNGSKWKWAPFGWSDGWLGIDLGIASPKLNGTGSRLLTQLMGKKGDNATLDKTKRNLG
jgi:hypothetical protein